VGEIIVAVLAQIADLERTRIRQRCDSGRQAARASLSATGRTHRGKASLGRPQAANAHSVREWRNEQKASIAATASHFGIGHSTVKRYCAAQPLAGNA
jgi:putative DNA-invertase from lambdoid prophage Rac